MATIRFATMSRSALLSSLTRYMSTTDVPHTVRRPLEGVKVVELAGLAPAPFCGLILADFGATVTLVEKPSQDDSAFELEQRLTKGKKRITIDLKSAEGIKRIRDLCSQSDVLLDPFRPGVLEKLGLDPVELIKCNKGLIVARITGYGQTGQLSQTPSHDINYVSMSGLLPTISGRSKRCTPYWPPANLLADFAGGALTAAFGILAALYRRTWNGGEGGIVDVSMTEGVAYLGTFITMYKDIAYLWKDKYAAFSGNCPIYRTYETSDGKYLAVGALEGKFRKEFFKALQLEDKLGELITEPQKLIDELETIFKTKTRDEWTRIFKDVEACVTPVLEMDEVGDVEHFCQRKSFELHDNKWIPQPAPRIYTVDEFSSLREKDKSKI